MGTSFNFGPFRYDAAQRVLYRGQDIVALTPKTLDLLQVLLERQGQVVDKAELMKLVWPDAIVEETGLARNVSLLRKALGDESEQFIETVPKRGYRFVAAQTPAVPPAPRRRAWWWWAVGAAVPLAALIYTQFYRPSRYLPPGQVSLAVVPFVALGTDAAAAAGMSEAVLAEIAKLPGVHAVNSSTLRRYLWAGFGMQVIARLLGLQVVVEGAVQKSGVTVRLVDVHTAKLIWAENYPPGDPAETARAIAAQVGAHLTVHASFPTSH